MLGALIATLIATLITFLYFCFRITMESFKTPIVVNGGSEKNETDHFIDVDYQNDAGFIEEGPFVADENQEYLNRDYTKIIFTRFPLFTKTSHLPSSWKQDWNRANGIIRKTINHGRGKHWTNQTLSYMRNRKSFQQIMDICTENNIHLDNIVDATANLGGDCLSFAMAGASNIIAYEILPEVAEMLANNVKLFRCVINVRPRAFDYDVPQDALVIIDPPYEKGNNSTNYNLSIDDSPICVVCDKILNAGAKWVLISMPKDYRYNRRYAVDHKQTVKVYPSAKNVKFFLVSRAL
jgi:hypothetical protein